MENTEVRVRIAPSPTGDWHLGTLRTALFTYLFARHTGGKFYLRIEDTDQARLVPGAIERILDILKWLDLNPDHFDDGRPYVVQSENLKRYQTVAHELVEKGHAYYCFATPDELAAMRHEQEVAKKPPRYNNRWGYRDLPLTEAKERVDAGDTYVIRQKMPLEGETVFRDLILGDVTVKNSTLDDHVLLKSDGFPTYHLAHVVDDHDMKITHVIRGSEWLPSAPRHVQLHHALGWDLPFYVHVPVILGPDKGKLAKRHGAKSVLEYRDQGYLPQALLNFLILLGWSSGTEQEFFTRDEMIELFDFTRVHPSPAMFDQGRLDWFNAHYIRRLSGEELRNQLLVYWDNFDSEWRKRYEADAPLFDKVVSSLHERLVTLKEFAQLAEFYYLDQLTYDPSLLLAKGQTEQECLETLIQSLNLLKQTDDWSLENLETVLRAFCQENNIKPAYVLWPIRAALSGLPASPSTFEVLSVLGKEKSLRRIEQAMTKLQ